MATLWTPWRLAYITSDKKGPSCIFCAALASSDDAATLLVHRGEHAFVILNRYPYSNGHLMVAPNGHCGTLHETPAEARSELLDLAARCEQMLADLYRPDGFNLGINLGRPAGAGVVGHLHLHIVPRWEGDTNFMTVINEVRVIPERLEDTWARIRARFA